MAGTEEKAADKEDGAAEPITATISQWHNFYHEADPEIEKAIREYSEFLKKGDHDRNVSLDTTIDFIYSKIESDRAL